MLRRPKLKAVWVLQEYENGKRKYEILWSIVVLLAVGKGPPSGMQVAGCRPVFYEQVGDACMFPAEMWHQSLQPASGDMKDEKKVIWKVTFFFGKTG